MQELTTLPAVLEEISFIMLLVGIFYTFGIFLLSRLLETVYRSAYEPEEVKGEEEGAKKKLEQPKPLVMSLGDQLTVTIGTALASFGLFGAVMYRRWFGLHWLIVTVLQFVVTVSVVIIVRKGLDKYSPSEEPELNPRDTLGKRVVVMTTVRDDFGEVSIRTKTGDEIVAARAYKKGDVFKEGASLTVVSADDEFVYVNPTEDEMKGAEDQSKEANNGLNQ
ncbi:hypothetical protein EU538_09185 [Candidatus Thorarchaeota archaeon]|nr:MAG: hypothetical protein EU538_09185 [Candidatus Thorarchaeota archaeon]